MTTHLYTPYEGKTFGVRYFDGEPFITSVLEGEDGYRFIDTIVPAHVQDKIVPNTRFPLDVWLRHDNDAEEDTVDAEANTYLQDDGTFRIEWYLDAVGLVTRVYKDTYEDAVAWYEREGFQDFTTV